MFVHSLLLYLSVYIVGFTKYFDYGDDKEKRKKWDTFTRVISSINALQCIFMVYYSYLDVLENGHNLESLMYHPSSFSTNSLFAFSAYLFVDGTFQLLDFKDGFSFGLILSIVHHFVGGLGIYMIAKSEMGFFLGFYFAMTEISTPFLNLSWYYRHNFLLYCFYITFFLSRIYTIPSLLVYLNLNESLLNELHPLQIFMSYYGSYTLILLNCVWFLFLSNKVAKIML